MNKTDMKYFEGVVTELYIDAEKGLNIEHEVSLQESKFYLEHKDFVDTIQEISDIEKELKELSKRKDNLYGKLREALSVNLNIYDASYYSLAHIKETVHNYYYKKVNEHLEDYETGRKIIELKKEKRNSLLALRLLQCDADIKEFLKKLFERFGKTLPS